jgi:hypothetical protein
MSGRPIQISTARQTLKITSGHSEKKVREYEDIKAANIERQEKNGPIR